MLKQHHYTYDKDNRSLSQLAYDGAVDDTMIVRLFALCAGNYRPGIRTNTLFQHFEWTATTAHCSVHMPKHLSDKAGQSDRCAMPS